MVLVKKEVKLKGILGCSIFFKYILCVWGNLIVCTIDAQAPLMNLCVLHLYASSKGDCILTKGVKKNN